MRALCVARESAVRRSGWHSTEHAPSPLGFVAMCAAYPMLFMGGMHVPEQPTNGLATASASPGCPQHWNVPGGQSRQSDSASEIRPIRSTGGSSAARIAAARCGIISSGFRQLHQAKTFHHTILFDFHKD